MASVAGIYISWPFCAQKCTYCNFASGVQPNDLEDQYFEALLAEMRAQGWQWKPETSFIGGGTPSAIEPARIEALLDGLPGRPWLEATIEAAPGSLTFEKVEAWKRAGINRASLGAQSFVKAELARTGRKHDAATVERDVALLRSNGIENINVDLIAGLPGQTPDSWRTSLDAVIRLNVPHVSVYMLEVDEDSRLGAEILLGGKRYGAIDVPSEDSIAMFYEMAVDLLARHGIERYEISNFARAGAESRHNMKYWRREPYVGFGADAHSFDGVLRWQNVEAAREYVDRWSKGEPIRLETSAPNPLEEKFFVGLRLSEGVAPDESDWRRFGAAFERFLSGGVIERSGDRLRLTPRGIMVSNEIFEEFLIDRPS
jgi:oxygen-independent coproporphyrinogen-3 oxidase